MRSSTSHTKPTKQSHNHNSGNPQGRPQAAPGIIAKCSTVQAAPASILHVYVLCPEAVPIPGKLFYDHLGESSCSYL